MESPRPESPADVPEIEPEREPENDIPEAPGPQQTEPWPDDPNDPNRRI